MFFVSLFMPQTMKYLYSALIVLFYSCSGNGSITCEQLQRVDGFFYNVEEGQEYGPEIGQYSNLKRTLDSLLYLSANNTYVALDSLEFYKREKDTFRMVMQYVKMLRDKELPERKHEIMVQFHSILTDSVLPFIGPTAGVIYDQSQKLIKNKNSYENFLVYDALNNCMNAEIFNTITQITYNTNYPQGKCAEDSLIAFKMNWGYAKFLQFYQYFDLAFDQYHTARTLVDPKFLSEGELNARNELIYSLKDYYEKKHGTIGMGWAATVKYQGLPDLYGELHYLYASFLKLDGRASEAFGWYQAGGNTAKSKYVKLINEIGLQSVDNIHTGEESMLKQIDLQMNIQKEYKTRLVAEKANYETIKLISKKVQELQNLLSSKNIDPKKVSLEIFTGACIDARGNKRDFESGVPKKAVNSGL
jgi:hypothetical protein